MSCAYITLIAMIINNQSRQILQMSNTSKPDFLRNIKIFVNYVSKYYNGTPSVRNRLISYTQVDMTCPRRVERDIPHLQWHNFLRFKQMCILRNINDTVTMWCLMLFITWQWLWIKSWINFTFRYYLVLHTYHCIDINFSEEILFYPRLILISTL